MAKFMVSNTMGMAEEEEETVSNKLSNDGIANSVSDEDPGFVPSDASADSAEEDSGGEDNIVGVVDKSEEIEATEKGERIKDQEGVEKEPDSMAVKVSFQKPSSTEEPEEFAEPKETESKESEATEEESMCRDLGGLNINV